MGDGFVLWGRARIVDWAPIKVMGGTERECHAEQDRRFRETIDGEAAWRELTVLPTGEAFERGAWICGYFLVGKRSTAGRFGCDPCAKCSRRPEAGEQVWHLSGLLICDRCSIPAPPAGERVQPKAPACGLCGHTLNGDGRCENVAGCADAESAARAGDIDDSEIMAAREERFEAIVEHYGAQHADVEPANLRRFLVIEDDGADPVWVSTWEDMFDAARYLSERDDERPVVGMIDLDTGSRWEVTELRRQYGWKASTAPPWTAAPTCSGCGQPVGSAHYSHGLGQPAQLGPVTESDCRN